MKILFNKYQGAGNDFIIIRNTPEVIGHNDKVLIRRLCDRRFGIGADGLILVEECDGYDFRMIYMNSDGSRGAMCGNGARCACHFAMRSFAGFRDLTFIADDGPHTAHLKDHGMIEVSIGKVTGVKQTEDGFLVNTGVPHLVIFTDNTERDDFVPFARSLRHSDRYAPEGVNVNLVQVTNKRLRVRTYERGVEDETFACGTGVTASAIAAALAGNSVTDHADVSVRGGQLSVRFTLRDNGANDIYLTGPATFVFDGETEI